jgi:uncharacterized protein YbaP (TraB family)
MRALVLSLFVVLFAFGCSPKTTVAKTQKAPPRPELVGPPPAPASAPPKAMVDTEKFAPTANDTSLLWRITAPGVVAPSYLFGTIHIIPAEDYFMPSTVIKALNDSKSVVFEIDPKEMSNPATLMGLMTKINMRNDTSLSDLLTAEQYTEVEEYFTAAGLPFFLFKRMKPMFLSAMVGQDMDAMGGLSGGEEPASGGMKSYELELSKIAEAGNKDVSGLESIEFQLSIFDSIPYRAQAVMLYDAITADGDEDSPAASQLDALVNLYKRQAVAELAQTIMDESAGISNFEDLLLTKRNANWVPVIKSATMKGDTGSSFYAVGAGHLGGKNGVIALLRAEGLVVEPVY